MMPGSAWRSGWGALVGQVRFRRYRPFVVPVKSKLAEKSVSEIRASPESTESVPVHDGSARLFQVGPLHAMNLLQAFSVAADPSAYITLSLRLDVDTKRQSVRGVCHLPHGLRTRSKIAVFCSDFDAAEMIEAGADFAGMTELLQRIGKGWTGFERCIATPAVMPQVMKVAKVLGPRKLMPNPKSGTLVTDLKRAIIEAKSGTQLEYRTEEVEPVVSVRIGALDAPMANNLDNMKFFVREVLKHKNRQTANSASDSSESGGRLVTVGGISMLPDAARLSRLLGKTVAKTGSPKKQSLFVQSATLQIELGNAEPLVVQLDPDQILPTSPAYYRQMV